MGLQVVIRGSIMAIWAMTKVVGKSDAWLILFSRGYMHYINDDCVLVTLAFRKQSIVQTLTE